MSKCISRKGEYSEHETLDERFCCVDCGAFDEDAVIAFYAGPIRRVEALADRWYAAVNLGDGSPSFVMQSLAKEVLAALRGDES